MARLNANGTLDETFVPSGFTPYGFFSGTPFPIRGIAIQSDGKIVIGGRFSGGNCDNQVPLVRLNADGSRDNNYIYTGCLPLNEQLASTRYAKSGEGRKRPDHRCGLIDVAVQHRRLVGQHVS